MATTTETARPTLAVAWGMAYTSMEFQKAREALLACNDADRAYLRRWIMRWIDDYRHIRPDAEKLREKGC